MIEQSEYLPKQFNGPVINATMQALNKCLEDSDSVCEYLHGLSIRTAQETELENIGRILGYPRPLVPEGFEQESVFLFTTILETDATMGFSTVDSEVGGRFVSTGLSESNYMDLGLYRKFLDKIAYIKRYGITLSSVDSIAKAVDDNYTIEYDENSDFVLTFANSIGFKNLWVLSSLFQRFATSPQVQVFSGDQ